MANIATLLARILTTRYGRDMRQDLHDAIEAVNDDTETALGKKLTFATNTRKLKLLAKDDSVLSEVVIPGGGSGGGSVDSVNGLFPDENGNVEVNLDDINDVDITSVSNGDALVYDATSHKWVNGAGGGGTSDYSQLTNKPSINGVTLSGNKTSADLGISGGGSNENLVPNGWFNINTKNVGTFNASFDGTSKIDSWLTNVNSGGQAWTWASDTNTIFLNCTLGTGFGQIVHEFDKNPLISGKEFTLSVLYADGTIKTKTATYQNSSSAEWTTDIYSGSFAGVYSVPSSNNYLSVYFRCNEGYSALIKAIKLEIGGSSTLIVDTFPNSNLEKVRCNGVMRSNRNLLDNAWFTVNQRNKSGAIGVIGYFLDRWTLDSGTITIESDKTVSIGARTIVAEYIEQNVVGKQVTVSALLSDASIKKATFTVLADTYNSGSDGVLSLVVDTRSSVQSNGSKAKIVLYNTDFDNAITIQSVKLELGTESTLALDVTPNYTEELLKCQRYYYRITAQSNYSNIAMGMGMPNLFHVDSVLKLPTHMRTTPTLNVAGTLDAYTNGSNITSTSISVHSWCGDIIALNLGFSSSDTIQSAPYILRLGNQGDYIEFKAEL